MVDDDGQGSALASFPNVGRPVSQSMILDHVWNPDFDPQTNVVEVLVSRLWTKVDADFPEKLIHTVRGVGFVLRPPETHS